MNKNIFWVPLSLFLLMTIAGSELISAQMKYDIKEMTPEVEAALNNRRERFDQLRGFKSAGVVGENNRGYVELLKDDAEAKRLVDAENRDRKTVYKTIEQQNNLSNALETIETVFAQVQREKAQAGDKVQEENGQWVTK